MLATAKGCSIPSGAPSAPTKIDSQKAETLIPMQRALREMTKTIPTSQSLCTNRWRSPLPNSGTRKPCPITWKCSRKTLEAGGPRYLVDRGSSGPNGSNSGNRLHSRPSPSPLPDQNPQSARRIWGNNPDVPQANRWHANVRGLINPSC